MHIFPRSKVTSANNSREALELLRRARFSCVFCDMHMPPGDDGLKTVAALRAFEADHGLAAQVRH